MKPQACLVLILASFLLVLEPAAAAVSSGSSPPVRPNVLLILADDLGFSDLGCYGGEIRTPNLDRLAAEGMRFTQFYNCGVCVMTRASLYTGLYPRQGPGGLLRPDMPTLGEIMRGAGYATSLIGKWHLGSVAPLRPIDRGFDDYYGVLSGACNYFDPSIPDPVFYAGNPGAVRPFADGGVLIQEFPDGYYTTDAFSDRAIQAIKQAARIGTPFFVNLCYTAPHFPLQAPAEDIVRYRGRYHDGYERLRQDRFERQVRMGIVDPAVTRLSLVDVKSGPFRYDYDITPWQQRDDETRQREEERMEVYAAMVDRMDQGIGRVLAALDEYGVADDTIVFFLSDNGGCASLPEEGRMGDYDEFNRAIPLGDARGYEFVGPAWGWAQNAPFRRHKAWVHEGGICTPMIVRWPGAVAPGTLTRAVGHVVDFMPTLLELSGGLHPPNRAGRAVLLLEGRSLRPILRGEGTGVESRAAPLCWELLGNRAVRDGDWKLVWGASDQRWELYQLAIDRSETLNRAADEPARVAAMAAAWERWAEETETER